MAINRHPICSASRGDIIMHTIMTHGTQRKDVSIWRVWGPVSLRQGFNIEIPVPFLIWMDSYDF